MGSEGFYSKALLIETYLPMDPLKRMLPLAT